MHDAPKEGRPNARPEDRLEVTYAYDVDQIIAAMAHEAAEDPRLHYGSFAAYLAFASIPGFAICFVHGQANTANLLAAMLAVALLALGLRWLVFRSQVAELLQTYNKEATVGITPDGFDLRQEDYWGNASWGSLSELVETGHSVQFHQFSGNWVAPRSDTLEIPRHVFESDEAYRRFVETARGWWQAWKASGAAPNAGDASHWPADIRESLAGKRREFSYRHKDEDAGRLDALGEVAASSFSKIVTAAVWLIVATVIFLFEIARANWHEDDPDWLLSVAWHIGWTVLSAFMAIYYTWQALRPRAKAFVNPIVRVALTPKAFLIWNDWGANHIPARMFFPVSFVEEFVVFKTPDGHVRFVVPREAFGTEKEEQRFFDEYAEANLQAFPEAMNDQGPPSSNPYHPPKFD